MASSYSLPASVPWWSILLPLLLLPVGALAIRRQNAAKLLREKGIGRGAPGFQTGVRKLAVSRETAAKLQRGEAVTDAELRGETPTKTATAPPTPSKAIVPPSAEEVIDGPPPAFSTRSRGAGRKSEASSSAGSAPSSQRALKPKASKSDFLPETFNAPSESKPNTRRRVSGRNKS